MSVALPALVAASILGILQWFMPGDQGVMTRRNFAETFPVFVLLVALASAFGMWSDKSDLGAVSYLAGRVLYVVCALRPLRPVRKFAWGLSIFGLVGVAAGPIEGLAASLGR